MIKEYNTEYEFFQKVYSYISKNLSEKETIDSEKAFEKGSRYYRADLYLPAGCRNLDILPCSIIELKMGLRPDTLFLLHDLFLKNREIWGIQNFYVVYSNRNQFSWRLLSDYKKYNKDKFYVFSESEFIKGGFTSSSQYVHRPSWKERRTEIIKDARQDFSLGHNTFFFGAGLGPDVKMPTWNELLGDLMEKAQIKSHSAIGRDDYSDIDTSCNHSALIIGRYIESGFASMDEFKKQMHASLYKNSPKPDSELFKAIVAAIKTNKVNQVVTFNYDDLVETALINHGIDVHSVFDRTHFSGNEFPVYHVHGMIPQFRQIDSTPVLSEKEYHTLYKESFHWSNVVQLQALSSTTCFFIGLSMNDPNLRRLLDISSNGMGTLSKDTATGRACHYAILERKPLNSQAPNAEKDNEHFTLQERMMQDLGINIIWYDYGKYDEIPSIIRKLI
jgi:hypothetical protein